MILNSAIVEQTVDRDERGRFVKELVLARFQAKSGELPLAMVRKRSAPSEATRAGVLLVHGYGQNRYAWHLPSRSFSNYLARGGFDVFNLDLRGHGRSRHLGAKRPEDVGDFVREDIPAALDEIRKVRGEGPIFYVGHSLGGLIGYAAASVVKDALAGVVTLGSPYLFTKGARSLALIGWAMLALDRRVPLGTGAMPLKFWGEAIRLARVFVESPVFPLPFRGFHPGSMEPVVLGQHMSLAMDSGSITVLRSMFKAAAESRAQGTRMGWLSDFAPAFEALDLPLLVVAGTKDDLAPPASVAPAYERSRSSDKTYRTFPRGHIDLLVGQDAPQTIWPLVESWMAARLRRR